MLILNFVSVTFLIIFIGSQLHSIKTLHLTFYSIPHLISHTPFEASSPQHFLASNRYFRSSFIDFSFLIPLTELIIAYLP